jgi:hypothetical protein
MWDDAPVTKTLLFPSGIPSDRPSDRPTLPTLPPPEDPSDEDLVALSERDFLDDDPDVDSGVTASTLKPPPNGSSDEPPRRRSWLLPALRIAAAGLLLLVAIVLLLDPSPTMTSARGPRVAWPDRLTLASPAASAPVLPAANACVATAAPRFVAPRALVNPGLEVSSTETGFVVAFASATDEASAVRLEGTMLRAAETLRVRPHASAPIRRVVARDVDASLEAHADADDSRIVLAETDGPPFRIALAGTYLVARTPDRTRSLWSMPLPPKDRRIDALRVAPRDDGGAVVVAKRGNALHLGFVNGALSPTGPLQTITRPNATLGTPFVVANGGGAALAWAERANGAREWTVMVASMGGGELETKPIAAGMSPSLGVFPDGTLAVAYADGAASAHRIVVRRLGADLSPLGDPLIASEEGLNAGQPIIDIRPDGRALVAWFAVTRGQPPSVRATPLVCDVSTRM